MNSSGKGSSSIVPSASTLEYQGKSIVKIQVCDSKND